MMKLETRCVKIELKPESLERVREWALTLNGRPDEVLATLRDEGVTLEAAFLDEVGEKTYLIYIMKAESMSHARAVADKSTHSIDAYHRGVMREICGPRKELEILIDFDRSDEVIAKTK
jgi:hypothetical protein